MKVSLEEIERIRRAHLAPADSVIPALQDSDEEMPIRIARGEVFTRSEEVQTAKAHVDAADDIREQIVNILKARIESKAYRVSAEEIADLMVRRALADSYR